MTWRDASLVGTPIPGCPGIGALTSEQDWVVTGSNYGQGFRLYVSPHVSRDEAIRSVVSAMRFTPDGLEWIAANRRIEVERCVRMDGDWLRSRTI